MEEGGCDVGLQAVTTLAFTLWILLSLRLFWECSELLYILHFDHVFLRHSRAEPIGFGKAFERAATICFLTVVPGYSRWVLCTSGFKGT